MASWIFGGTRRSVGSLISWSHWLHRVVYLSTFPSQEMYGRQYRMPPRRGEPMPEPSSIDVAKPASPQLWGLSRR
jgi:hypothetical protein